MNPTLRVLFPLNGAIASEGFATHVSTVMLSTPGKVQLLATGLRRIFTLILLTCPASA
jgi:hypothetical protein